MSTIETLQCSTNCRKNTSNTFQYSIATKCFRPLLGLFFPNLLNQSSCRILTLHAKTRPILHHDWSIKLGDNRLYQSLIKVLKHSATMLLSSRSINTKRVRYSTFKINTSLHAEPLLSSQLASCQPRME